MSVLLVTFIPAIFMLAAIPMVYVSGYVAFLGLFVCGFTLAFIAFVVWSLGVIRYEIEGGKLHVTMGSYPYQSVDIADIVSVERSYNPIATMTTYSLKRLRIGLRREGLFPFMLISPVREEEFIAELKAVNPDIRVDVPVKTGAWRILDWDI